MQRSWNKGRFALKANASHSSLCNGASVSQNSSWSIELRWESFREIDSPVELTFNWLFSCFFQVYCNSHVPKSGPGHFDQNSVGIRQAMNVPKSTNLINDQIRGLNRDSVDGEFRRNVSCAYAKSVNLNFPRAKHSWIQIKSPFKMSNFFTRFRNANKNVQSSHLRRFPKTNNTERSKRQRQQLDARSHVARA